MLDDRGYLEILKAENDKKILIQVTIETKSKSGNVGVDKVHEMIDFLEIEDWS
jgi:hypothetical protein